MAKAKKKTAKPSTALAVRAKKTTAPKVIIEDPKGLLPVQSNGIQSLLGETPDVSVVGLIEIKLTPEEEAALGRPVNVDDILIKPDGVPYIPWAGYSKWFTSAFGRFGWSVVACGLPKKADNLVLMPYKLFIHGQPVAITWGEQEYHPDNKRQTFGDAIESTRGSALRRFAKQFDIGLELWDKVFLAQWKDEHCIAVTVERRGDKKTEWRRKVDPPLPGEVGIGRSRQKPSSAAWPETVETERKESARTVVDTDSLPITNEQRKRLTDIAQRAGREAADVQLWLKKRYGYSGTKDITRAHYAEICRQLEARGPLTMPGDAE